MAQQASAKKKRKKDLQALAVFTRGIIKENSLFVLLLGMCPALAVTSSLETGLGMGLLVIFVLTLSNIVVSLIRKVIPDEIRIPAYIVVIATFVTIVGLLTEAFAPALHESLGIFIPLIVVNCLIMERANNFASKNNVLMSAIDGIGVALGFMLALMLIGGTREFLATGAIAYGIYLPLPFEGSIINAGLTLFQMEVFIGPAGGFIVIGFWLAVFKAIELYNKRKKKEARDRWIEKKKKEAAERKRRKAMESAGGSA